MVGALDPGLGGQGSCFGRGHCAVFLGKHCTVTVRLSTQVYKWAPEFNGRGNPALDSQPNSRKSRNTPSPALCYRNWRVSAGLMEPLSCIQTLPFTPVL